MQWGSMIGKLKTGNEQGFVLIAALLIMVVLTLLGIAANRNTSTELLIAGNDKLQKKTFYDADGGSEFASEVLEQNIACIKFSTAGAGSTATTDGTAIVLDGTIAVANASAQFWQNGLGTWTLISNPFPSDAARDMWYPPNYGANEPHTNITVEGGAELTTDSAILFAAGYLGLGRSASAGGATLKYEVYSRHVDVNNSESLVRVEWNHVVGREDPQCKYD